MINITEPNGDQIVLSDNGTRGTRNGIPLTPQEARAAYEKALGVAVGVGAGVTLLGAATILFSVAAPLWLGRFVEKKTKSKALGIAATVGAFYIVGPEISGSNGTIFPPYKDEVKQALGFQKKLPAIWNQAYWKGA